MIEPLLTYTEPISRSSRSSITNPLRYTCCMLCPTRTSTTRYACPPNIECTRNTNSCFDTTSSCNYAWCCDRTYTNPICRSSRLSTTNPWRYTCRMLCPTRTATRCACTPKIECTRNTNACLDTASSCNYAWYCGKTYTNPICRSSRLSTTNPWRYTCRVCCPTRTSATSLAVPQTASVRGTPTPVSTPPPPSIPGTGLGVQDVVETKQSGVPQL